MIRRSVFIALVLVLASYWVPVHTQGYLPVVPGAYGYGMQTRAAYGLAGSNPTVYTISTLAGSGAGSFKEAAEASGPRVIIFEVSGYIDLTSQLIIDDPYLVVAGQTAPSPGVTFRCSGTFATECMFLVWTHDTLIQHIAIRPGDTTCNSGIQYYDGGSGSSLYNNVLDHVSISWSQDDNVVINDDGGNSTVWRSIISEILVNTPGSGDCQGGGYAQNGIGIGTGDNISLIQNLFAHLHDRNPQVNGGSTVYMANNLIYAPAIGPMWINQPFTNLAFDAALIGNYFRRDSQTDSCGSLCIAVRVMDPSAGTQMYITDNIYNNGPNLPNITEFYLTGGDDPRVGSLPFPAPTGYTPLTAAATYDHVLLNAGARPTDRDDVDERIVATVQNRTGDHIANISEVGGYPTLAQNTRDLTVPANPHNVQPSGYTVLEEWLHSYAEDLEGEPSPGTFWVSPSGSDANACLNSDTPLSTTAKLTIMGGASCLVPGSTLYVRAGTYTGDGLGNAIPSGTSWTAAATIAGYSTDVVTIRPSAAWSHVVAFSSDEHYIVLDKLVLDGVNTLEGVVSLECDSGGEAHHVRIKNSTLIGGGAGAAVRTTADVITCQGGHEFQNITLHGGGTNDTHHGMYLSSPSSLVEFSNIYDVLGAGIRVYNSITGSRTNGTILRSNYIHALRTSTTGQNHWGIFVTGSTASVDIYNNIINGVPTNGASAHGIEIAADAVDNVNNTIYNAGGIGMVISGGTANVVRNTIAYASAGVNYTDGGTNTDDSHNMFSVVDPLFVNGSGTLTLATDFQVQAASDAIDNGLTVSMVTHDFTGITTRPQNNGYDIGAYESSYTEPPPSTLRPGRVRVRVR